MTISSLESSLGTGNSTGDCTRCVNLLSSYRDVGCSGSVLLTSRPRSRSDGDSGLCGRCEFPEAFGSPLTSPDPCGATAAAWLFEASSDTGADTEEYVLFSTGREGSEGTETAESACDGGAASETGTEFCDEWVLFSAGASCTGAKLDPNNLEGPADMSTGVC